MYINAINNLYLSSILCKTDLNEIKNTPEQTSFKTDLMHAQNF